MNYNISSNKFINPLIKEILQELSKLLYQRNIDFYLIGATARDILMQIHNQKSSRATRDLDIAIGITNWEEFIALEEQLCRNTKFNKDHHNTQRFTYDGFPIDFVPFGDVISQNDQIFWPPNQEIAMSILGFKEASEDTKEVIIDQEFSIKVASLAGIFLLKLVAWHERNIEGNKDADDLAFIIQNYFNIYTDRFFQDYLDYVDDDFSMEKATGILLGEDLKSILSHHPESHTKISDILSKEIQKKEESRLIQQILETHPTISFQDIYSILKHISQHL